jgi:protein-tyrosine phosphatase
MGNICRSPTAEGVFRYHAEQAGLAGRLEIDSAGTHAYHVGEPADHRARAAAERRGMSLDGIRARRVSAQDFQRFDYIIAMFSNLQLAQKRTFPIPTMVGQPGSNVCLTSWKTRLEACSRRCPAINP